MESEYESETDEDRESNNKSESEIYEKNTNTRPTLNGQMTVVEPTRTMNDPSVLRPSSGDVMADVVSTHNPPPLPLEVGQSGKQNRPMCGVGQGICNGRQDYQYFSIAAADECRSVTIIIVISKMIKGTFALSVRLTKCA